MRVFRTDHFALPLPAGHRFPIDKYARLYQRVAGSAFAEQLDFEVPAAATRDQLLLAHDPHYVDRVLAGTLTRAEIRELGFPWSPALVERSSRSVGGTLAAVRSAVAARSVAVTLSGGTHHAMRDRGQGYCVFNDLAVAARFAQTELSLRRVLIFDVDVHQGDGTAAIFADDPTVLTVSLHGDRNYPSRKPPSTLDLGLPDECDDAAYLCAIDRALEFVDGAPDVDLVIYLAGVDPFVDDRLGRLAVTEDGLRRRDERCLKYFLTKRRLPVAVTMGGGYAAEIDRIAALHAQTVEVAFRLCTGDVNRGPAL